MIEYYIQVSPLLLPCLQNRLVSLRRFPNGVAGQGFYQKNCPPTAPAWIKTYGLASGRGKLTNYVLIDDLATLIWLVNSGVIEFHPWLSRLGALDNPDFAVFDLDPAEGQGFAVVSEIAWAIKELLQQLSLRGQVKTSGATGLQIFVPLIPVYTYETAREFIHNCCRIIQRTLPQQTTLARSIKERQGKAYLDYLQNGRGKTIVSAYSLRSQPKPTISQPLTWAELRQGLAPADFSLLNWREGGMSAAWLEKIPGQRLEKSAEAVKNML